MNIFEDKTIFGTRLRQAITANQVNARYVSKATGLSESSICRYLSNEFTPKLEHTMMIAKVLHVDPLWLFGIDAQLTKGPEYRYCPWCGKKLKNKKED